LIVFSLSFSVKKRQHLLLCSTPALTLEVGVAVVEKDHANIAPVIFVHHAGPGVDEVLDSQAGAGRHAGIGAVGAGDGEVGLDDTFATGGDDCIFGAA
jgi:hypothetical protein